LMLMLMLMLLNLQFFVISYQLSEVDPKLVCIEAPPATLNLNP
jgi:hypothetical protein